MLKQQNLTHINHGMINSRVMTSKDLMIMPQASCSFSPLVMATQTKKRRWNQNQICFYWLLTDLQTKKKSILEKIILVQYFVNRLLTCLRPIYATIPWGRHYYYSILQIQINYELRSGPWASVPLTIYCNTQLSALVGDQDQSEHQEHSQFCAHQGYYWRKMLSLPERGVI